MPIVAYNETTATVNTTFYNNNTTTTGYYDSAPPPYANSNNNNNAFLISIEVIFSVLVLFILLFCFFAGLNKKKRIKRLNQDMIENAINQQERRIQIHLQGYCHSSSTVTTLIQLPPPSYSPPDPSNQLSNDAVSRLDHLFLLENQIYTLPNRPCSNTTTTAVSTSVTLPKYSDLYQNGVNRPN